MADPFISLSYLYNNVTPILVFLTTLTIAYYSSRRDQNVPPGPPKWPIFGNLFSLMDKDLLKKVSTLRQKYGDVCGVYIGSKLWVFLNGYDVIHDAIIKKGKLFSERPTDQYVRRIGFSGIILENGIVWKERKNFLLLALGKACYSENGKFIEEILQREITHFLQEITKIPNLATDPRHLISYSFTNIIIEVIYGQCNGIDRADIKKLVIDAETAVSKFAIFKVISSIITFEWFPWETFGIVDVKLFRKMRQFHSHLASNVVKAYIDEGNETCILHHYLKVLKAGEINGKAVSTGSFSMEYFNDLAQDLTVAGSETSATALKWILLYLALNIEVQKKLHKEIDDFVPKERLPSLSDRPCLTNVEATILEGLRIGFIAPLATPRTVTEDTMFHGFLFTKDTTIIPNLSSIFMDPEIFPEPDVFKPERFLDETGNHVVVPNQMIPFALGPRSCPGETLARIEVFLFLSAIMQKFELRLPDGMEKPSLKGILAETYKPQPYKIKFISRDQ